MPALNSVNSVNYTPILLIKVGNKFLGEGIMQRVSSVRVKLSMKKGNTLTITVKDDTYEIFDSNVFALDSYITIYCGWPNEVIKRGPFRITGYAPSYDDTSAPTLVVEAKDLASTTMQKTARSRSWKGNTTAEIVEKIAKDHGLNLSIDVAAVDSIVFDPETQLVQSAETDAAFLQRLADKLGYIWGVDNDVLYFQSPDKLDSSSRFNLHYKAGDFSIKSFKPKFKVFTPNTGGNGMGHTHLIMGNVDFVQDYATWYNDLLLIRRQEHESDFIGRELTVGEFEDLKLINGEGATRYDLGEDGTEHGGYLMNYNDQGASLAGTPAATQRSGRFPGAAGGSDVITFEDFVGREPDQQVAEIYTSAKDILTPMINAVRGSDGAQAIPMKSELGLLAQGAKRKMAVESAVLVPTIPSWAWETKTVVYINGVHKKAEGVYTVAEVELSVDNSNGLGTTLHLKKGRVGTSKKDTEQYGPINDADDPGNPRQPQSQDQPIVRFLPEGFDDLNVRGVFRRGNN